MSNVEIGKRVVVAGGWEMRFLSDRDSNRVSSFPLDHSNCPWASVIQFYENFGNRTEKEED
jgi:hypothetical protein